MMKHRNRAFTNSSWANYDWMFKAKKKQESTTK